MLVWEEVVVQPVQKVSSPFAEVSLAKGFFSVTYICGSGALDFQS